MLRCRRLGVLLMAEDLIIVGASGFAREAAWTALQQSDRWSLKGFLDDDVVLHGKKLLGYPVLGPVSHYLLHDRAKFVIAVGAPRTRHTIRLAMHVSDDRFGILIDPSDRFHGSVEFSPGSIFCGGVVATVDISFGAHLILNLIPTVGHDCGFG